MSQINVLCLSYSMSLRLQSRTFGWIRKDSNATQILYCRFSHKNSFYLFQTKLHSWNLIPSQRSWFRLTKNCFDSNEFSMISVENIGNKSVMYTLTLPFFPPEITQTATHINVLSSQRGSHSLHISNYLFSSLVKK